MVPQLALWGLVGAPVVVFGGGSRVVDRKWGPMAVSSPKMEQSKRFKGVIDSK